MVLAVVAGSWRSRELHFHRLLLVVVVVVQAFIDQLTLEHGPAGARPALDRVDKPYAFLAFGEWWSYRLDLHTAWTCLSSRGGVVRQAPRAAHHTPLLQSALSFPAARRLTAGTATAAGTAAAAAAGTADTHLHKLRRDYANPSSSANTSRLADELADVQHIMRRNIGEVLDRGEKLEREWWS